MPIRIIKKTPVPDTIEAHARNADPDTSHAAAEFTKHNLQHTEGIVLGYLQSHKDGTVDDIAQATGLQTETVSPRMRPLERKNMVRATDRRRCLPGKKVGRIVWEAV